jgi:cytochrome c
VERTKSCALGVAGGAFILLLTGLSLPHSGSGQSPASGKEVFLKRCGGCHALDRDKEGPQLRGVYGRKAGSLSSFQYSEALKKSNIVWTEETLERWLTDTEKLVPNNDMTFQVEKPDERRAIIEYLTGARGRN